MESTYKLSSPTSKKNNHFFWRCLGYLKPHWKFTLGAYLLALLIDGFNMVNPQLIRLTIDQGIRGNNLALMNWLVLALLAFTLIKGIFTYFQGYWTEAASQNVAFDLRNAIQSKLTQLSFSYHDKSEAGDLLSRAVQDVERIRFLTGRAVFRVADGILLLIITTIVMFWMNPRLALLAFIAMPILTYQAIVFGRKFRPLSMQIQKQLGALTTRVEQNLRGIRVVKTFAQDEEEIRRFAKENDRFFELSVLAARIQSTNLPLLNLIANLGSIFILWFGGSMVINNQLTLGELVAFTAYLGQLIQPVRQLGMILPAISAAESSAERIFEILDSIPDVHDRDGARPLAITRGHVQFENVCFSYSKRGDVLKGISFEAKPDQVVALLGLTGSGKTTIVNLIPRFYDPTSGCVLIDGVDISTVTTNSLRSQIGMVLQETTLFASTIRENLIFGRPDASEAAMVAAARDAQAHEFILETASGYDTLVGERGITLSGGQKQRIAIARALLTNPRILILDDATSSVDSETEHLIQKALDRLMHARRRTTFVIAHRLSTVQKADLILLLDKGRVAASGRHEELLMNSALYNEIYKKQLKG